MDKVLLDFSRIEESLKSLFRNSHAKWEKISDELKSTNDFETEELAEKNFRKYFGKELDKMNNSYNDFLHAL